MVALEMMVSNEVHQNRTQVCFSEESPLIEALRFMDKRIIPSGHLNLAIRWTPKRRPMLKPRWPRSKRPTRSPHRHCVR